MYDLIVTTPIAPDIDPLALERQVCFALAITNRAVQIATALQLDSATLSPMLKRLQALGLITRTRSTADERFTDIELTEDGIALRNRALEIPPAVVARLGVDVAELEHLHRVLTRINSAALAADALKI